MQIRKLVKSGAASHTIALPKDWLTKKQAQQRRSALYTGKAK